MKIDYGIGAYFGTWGRDLMALSSGIDENSPTARKDDAAFFRRFIKDPTRTSDIKTRFWKYMARDTGTYSQDVNGYMALMREGHDGEAQTFLDGLPAREKAFTILKGAGTESGRPAFNADVKRRRRSPRRSRRATPARGSIRPRRWPGLIRRSSASWCATARTPN